MVMLPVRALSRTSLKVHHLGCVETCLWRARKTRLRPRRRGAVPQLEFDGSIAIYVVGSLPAGLAHVGSNARGERGEVVAPPRGSSACCQAGQAGQAEGRRLPHAKHVPGEALGPLERIAEISNTRVAACQ